MELLKKMHNLKFLEVNNDQSSIVYQQQMPAIKRIKRTIKYAKTKISIENGKKHLYTYALTNRVKTVNV